MFNLKDKKIIPILRSKLISRSMGSLIYVHRFRYLNNNFSAYNSYCQYFLTHHFKHMFWVLIETVLLSTHNICLGGKIRKLFFVTHS